MNPMANQLNGGLANFQKIKQTFGMIKNMRNPQAAIGQMMQNNPQYKQAMDLVNQSGGDAKSAFFKLANDNGINPNEILDFLSK